MRYMAELEHKVHTLQTETTTLSHLLTLLQVGLKGVGIYFDFFFFILLLRLYSNCIQRDSAELTSRNNELKLRIQAMEQEAQFRDGTNMNFYFFSPYASLLLD